MPDFDRDFRELTGHSPFPWQRRLYDCMKLGEFPACELPTGLGKTSVIALWLLAVAEAPERVPRRLVYVVNRRTIVDQATREAENLRKNLQERDELGPVRRRLAALSGDASERPLAISTLRGQFADNGEWAADPARPAIIVGTVDMIGSRLLFSGYGRGFKSRPLHAGFLGQDSLIVHDEAHLEPAFQHLLDRIWIEQRKERCGDFRPLHVMPLTATPRTEGGQEPFKLEQADFQDKTIRLRLEAKKAIELHPIDDERKTAEAIAALAMKCARPQAADGSNGKAIIVFVRRVDDAKSIAERISDSSFARKHGAESFPRESVQTLTGTMRGLERDRMADPRKENASAVFARFLKPPSGDSAEQWKTTPRPGTVFLVCTSAGEVGVDISADHMVCDLTTFDSMAQRFGRVNRYGDLPNNSKIDIVHSKDFGESGAGEEYQLRREKTLALMKKLDGDGSPSAIAKLPHEERIAAFCPTPEILDATDILFDTWALTTIRERMPGRPAVADWLHGVAAWEPPETQVAWREEVQWISGDLLEVYEPDDLLEVYPVKPHELLKDRSKRVFDELRQIARRFEGNGSSECPEIPVWVKDDRGIEVTQLGEIVGRNEDAIANRIVILPPFAGGLSGGMLDGECAVPAESVADEWLDEDGRQRRRRVWDSDNAPSGMRAVRSAIDFAFDAGEAEGAEPGDHEDEMYEGDEVGRASALRPGRIWQWYVRPRSADDDGSRAACLPVLLNSHSRDVVSHAERILKALGLADTPEGRALVFAAEWHDLGKSRDVWQRSIWNGNYPTLVLAKSGNRRPPRDLNRYRHEFGSLLDVLSLKRVNELSELTEGERELVLHCIAAHHGRARPHFPVDEACDPAHPSVRAGEVAREIPRRFARLQQQYGRWGLAYLESILRAADAEASAAPSQSVANDGNVVVEAEMMGAAR